MSQREHRPITTPDGADLAVEATGLASPDVVLLIAGGGQSMDWWDDEWCASLVAAGLGVIRYDHRDTGESTSWPAGAPGYTATDLATDPLTILDQLGVDRAHVVGLSMGGGIAQQVAGDHPEREVARSRDVAASLTNHFTLEGEDLPRGALTTIAAPTLVIHGRDDPMFPIGHGEALAREIPGATLLAIDGMGHEIPPPTVRDQVMPALINHITARSSTDG